jgi:hypothetical protein
MHVFISAQKSSASANMILFLFRRYRLRKKFKRLILEDITCKNREKKLEESQKTNCKKLLQLFLQSKVLDAFCKREKQSKKRLSQLRSNVFVFVFVLYFVPQ